ncbi:MAG: outer membrane beta-barrel protein [Bacteroidetes bacterium]|nr:outer membrane beta-barrel protein [Bacteroidota bacterium]
MKKASLFLGFIVISLLVSAQVTLKPTAGFNLSNFSQDPSSGQYKSQVGWQLGGSIAFGKKFYIEPGLFYTGKSTKFVSSGSSSADIAYDINGFRIPVAIGFNLLGNEKSTLSIRGFGGASAFIVGTTNNINKDALNNATFGAFAGAGIDVWKMFADVSYEWSLSNIQKDITAINVGKSRSLFISVGLRINL